MRLKIAEDKGRSIGFLFGFLEQVKAKHAILDYSAQCTTLEQVFNHFAKSQGKNSVRFNKSFRKMSA